MNKFEMNLSNSYQKVAIDISNLPNASTIPPNKQNMPTIDINMNEPMSTANADSMKPDSKSPIDIVESKAKNKPRPPNRKRKSESSADGLPFAMNAADSRRNRPRRSRAKVIKPIVNSNKAIPKSLDSGVYVECDSCAKTRYLKDVLDPSEIPPVWTCEMEKNKTLNCDMLQENFDDSVDYFINNNYTLGSIVWAKAPGESGFVGLPMVW